MYREYREEIIKVDIEFRNKVLERERREREEKRRIERKRERKKKKEPKLLTRAKCLLHFFNVDTTQWNKAKAIKWMLSKAVFCIIVLGLGVYTAKTSLVLLVDYANSPTSYTPKILFNQSIALPLSKICLPLSPFELDDYWAKQDILSSLENATYYQNLTASYFDKITTTKGTLLSAEYAWPNFLLFVVYHYLNLIMQFEQLYGKQVIYNHHHSFIAEFEARYGKQMIEHLSDLNSSYND